MSAFSLHFVDSSLFPRIFKSRFHAYTSVYRNVEIRHSLEMTFYVTSITLVVFPLSPVLNLFVFNVFLCAKSISFSDCRHRLHHMVRCLSTYEAFVSVAVLIVASVTFSDVVFPNRLTDL